MVDPVVRTSPIARILALLLAAIGLVVAGGGVELALLGGSFYYVFGGIAVLASAWYLWRGDGRAGTVYGLFLVATLVWALWEVGMDGWALAPRLIAPAVLGLCFALPAVRRSGSGWLAPGAALVSLLVVVVVGAATSREPAIAGPRQTNPIAAIASPGEWPVWGRTLGGERFAPLDQIKPDNVKSLEVAWTYHTGVDPKVAGSPMIATPIMVGDRLYTCTQTNIVMALDPDTGKEIWRFDPKVNMSGRSGVTTCRGVAFFRAPQAADCQERIITTTFDAELLALDAKTGKLCPGFGKGGRVDMTAGMGDVPHGFYYGSSAPTIVRGKVVLGGWVADNQSTSEPSGVIRGFDAVTGQFAWAWDIGRPGNTKEPGPGEEYTRSTPNSWAPMSGDEALGLVFVPTGNPTPDHWGGKRSAATDKYGSSVVAIDVETGNARWSFQTAHRDLWDYDVASQPTLFDYTVGGRKVPAVAQATKRGQLFILDRRTGAPLVPVAERPAPQRGKAPDERLSPTQPYPVGFPSFAGDRLTEKDMWGVTPLDQLWCRIEFRHLRYDGDSTPPGLDRSLTYPSIGGGMNYGGVAFDPERDIMIVNSMYYGTILQLVPRAETDRLRDAATAGGGSHSVTNFAVPLPMAGTPYGARITGLMSPLNAPCNKPPYGKLSAVDMRTNKLLWSRPIGSARDTGPFGMASHLPIPMGMPMFSGSMVTRSGLMFIGATQDRTFRAFDTTSGRLLWSTRLPGGAQANPMSYVSPKTGRQYVVVSAGGHVMLRSPMSDAVVAFALPKK